MSAVDQVDVADRRSNEDEDKKKLRLMTSKDGDRADGKQQNAPLYIYIYIECVAIVFQESSGGRQSIMILTPLSLCISLPN
jgi:hypothetical protein